MSDSEAMSVAEMLAMLDAHPPDDARHALAHAIRESAADVLTAWTIVGEDTVEPIQYRQFLALGYVDGAFPPKYRLIPGVDDAESQAEMDELVKALAKERPLPTSLEQVRHLCGDPIKTLVYVGYGHASDTKETIVCLWHHPRLSLRRAVHLALLAISSDDTHRVKRGS